MAQKQSVRSSPEQIAEQARPNWKAVSGSLGAGEADSTTKPDLVMPEVSTLLRKYFGLDNADSDSVRAATSDDGSALVTMEPKVAQDVRVGRKAVVVQDGKIVGEQG